MTSADCPAVLRTARRIPAAPIAGTLGTLLLCAGLWTSLVPAPRVPLSPLVLLAAGAAACLGAFAWLSPVAKRRALLAVGGVAVSLGIAEAGLRVFGGAYFAPLYRSHGAWLFEYRPGARRSTVIHSGKGPETVAFEVNSRGFRGPELRPRGSQKRVVVYGDSFIAAASTRFEETYCERLRAALGDRTGADVEVVNAGVTGAGPDQTCLRMEAGLAALAPDLVVVAVLAENDYGDLVRNRLFELGPAGELVRAQPHMPRAVVESFEPPASVLVRSVSAAAASLWMSSQEPLPPADLREGYLAACRDEYGRLFTGSRDVLHPFWDHPDTDIKLDPASASARYKVALMERVLLRIRDVAVDYSVPLVFLVIPAATDVCEKYDGTSIDRERHPGYDPANRTRPIESAAAALGVPTVDLFTEFRAVDANDLYCHGGDTHWNSAGQALAAELTARRVAALRLLRRHEVAR